MNAIIEIIKYMLEQVYLFVGDWGVTIVIITVLIKSILMPFSIKQKNGIEHQQKMGIEMKEIKEKYKNQKDILQKEINKVSSKYAAGTLGCLLGFIQLPIIYSLYRAVSTMPMQMSTSSLLPWVSDIKAHDIYYIIPLIACVIQLMPSVLGYLKVFEDLKLPKLNKAIFISTLCINGFFVAQAPAIIGLYWIVSGIYTFIEQTLYYMFKIRKRRLANN